MRTKNRERCPGSSVRGGLGTRGDKEFPEGNREGGRAHFG